MLNTKYKELFSISWKFALAHTHVRSIRLDMEQQRKLVGLLSMPSTDSADAREVEMATREIGAGGRHPSQVELDHRYK